MLNAVEDAAIDAGLTLTQSSPSRVEAEGITVDLQAECHSNIARVTTVDNAGNEVFLEYETGQQDDYYWLLAEFATGAQIMRYFDPPQQLQLHQAVAASGRYATVLSGFDPQVVENYSYVVLDGDPAAVNASFSSIELDSDAWHIGFIVHWKWTGLEAVLDDERVTQAEKDAIFDSFLSVPIPYAAQDQDVTHTNHVCTAGLAVCGASLLGIISGVAACSAGGVACLAAGACILADCSGDG